MLFIILSVFFHILNFARCAFDCLQINYMNLFHFVFLHTSDEVVPRCQEGKPRTTNVTNKIPTEEEDDWTWILKRVAVRVCIVGLQ